MKQMTFRLKPGQLLREEIETFADANNIQAGVLLSVVGGLENAVLRMAGSDSDAQYVKEWNEPFEIVSGTGTISKNGCHIHASLSDREGRVIGGYLRQGCRVKYTAEMVIGIFDDMIYERIPDEQTGFDELVVKAVS